MKLKCLAAVGALLFAAPASALTVTEDGTVNQSGVIQGNSLKDVFSLVAGTYEFNLNMFKSNGNPIGSLSAQLIEINTSFDKILRITFGGGSSTTDSTSFSLTQAGTFRIDWNGGVDKTPGKGGTFQGLATIQSTTVAVPGPEAGAGIGALAMAGLAYAASRRRKLRAAA